MENEDYGVSITAFDSEEEYNNFIDISSKIDAFCTQAKILDTVTTSNKYIEASLDFCDVNGDIQNTVKVFSPVLENANGEREIFASIGSKVVSLGVESTFESIGTRLGTAAATAIVGLGFDTPPAWIMGTATGGAFYLGGKYIGIAVGHYAKQSSYDGLLYV